MRSGFFNSVNGDRRYNASSFAEFFSSFISNGVFPNPSTNFQIISNDDMSITVKPGKAWIDGHILINDSDHMLIIDVADGILNRIDRVVARLDTTDREIRVEIKKGAFASEPIATTLQRDADAYEIALADIYITKGAISISQANITDLRLNTELCGIVKGLVDEIDTSTIFNQYQAWLDDKNAELDSWLISKKTSFESDFNTWFVTIQDILDTNAAGNLLNEINTKANIISPALTGSPTAPTQVSSDNSTKIATTAFVKAITDMLARTDVITDLCLGSTVASSKILTEANYGKSMTKSTSFTLSDAECNKVLYITSAATITIPQDIITVIDAQIPIFRDTSDVVNFAPSGSAVLKSIDSKRAIKDINASATLIRKGDTNEWFLQGSLE